MFNIKNYLINCLLKLNEIIFYEIIEFQKLIITMILSDWVQIYEKVECINEKRNNKHYTSLENKSNCIKEK